LCARSRSREQNRRECNESVKHGHLCVVIGEIQAGDRSLAVGTRGRTARDVRRAWLAARVAAG
jgi:hypothetical protein